MFRKLPKEYRFEDKYLPTSSGINSRTTPGRRGGKDQGRGREAKGSEGGGGPGQVRGQWADRLHDGDWGLESLLIGR